MATRDGDYIPEQEEDEEMKEAYVSRKSKLHQHCSIITNEQTGKKKLTCNYCPSSYAYTQGNTRSMRQHLRNAHRDIAAVAQDIPATPAKSQGHQKRVMEQRSIANLKPMAPDNRIATTQICIRSKVYLNYSRCPTWVLVYS